MLKISLMQSMQCMQKVLAQKVYLIFFATMCWFHCITLYKETLSNAKQFTSPLG